MRSTILTLCLIPYVYFGVKDLLHHKLHRRVEWAERLLHLTLGLTLAIVIPHAYLGHTDAVIPGALLFVAARVVDEMVFHRNLDVAEIDLHAKTHFGFLVFVVGMIGSGWLRS